MVWFCLVQSATTILWFWICFKVLFAVCYFVCYLGLVYCRLGIDENVAFGVYLV